MAPLVASTLLTIVVLVGHLGLAAPVGVGREEEEPTCGKTVFTQHNIKIKTT